MTENKKSIRIESHMENKNKEIGALWEKTSKAGNKFKSGYVQLEGGERVEVVVFTNQYKKAGENTPDFRIYLSEQKGSNQEQAPARTPAKNSAPKVTEESSEVDADEIPF